MKDIENFKIYKGIGRKLTIKKNRKFHKIEEK